MKKNVLTLFFVLMLIFSESVASTNYFFYVQLANKTNSPYSISAPSAYLSQRAIERRSSFNIAIDSTDLPINPTYLSALTNLNIPIFTKSKWLNGVTVLVADSSVMSRVRALPYVRSATYTGQSTSSSQGVPRKKKTNFDIQNYGNAAVQLNQVNGSYLHSLGYTGKEVHVAVLDAGFLNVNNNPGFDSLRIQGRLLGTKDFTEKTPNIFGSDAHGSNVLSIMAGNIPGSYLGTAPHASYWLIRTEYDPTEYLCETDFWVAGVEFADSVGVDVVNSSLGYTTFDDPTLNFRYSNMNGSFSRASIAATIASKKGIIVCNSAGNEGNKSWYYVGSPADASGIVSVGAVTSTGVSSVFSSFGPTSDKRIKPEVCAMGTSTAYINTSGVIVSGNGTSYASPLMAGMFACLVQYAKEKIPNYSVSSLIESVKRSASLFPFPTPQMGYGIPDFKAAAVLNSTSLNKLTYDAIGVRLRVVNQSIVIDCDRNEAHQIQLFNASGQLVYNSSFSGNQYVMPTDGLIQGIYLVKIKNSIGLQTGKFQL